MPTIADVLTRVEKRISMAAGMDVQVHAEDQLLEMLRHKYNVLFDDVWWYDFLTLETFVLDGVTGTITGTVENKIRRFNDIHSVFLGGNNRPLPLLNIGTNPTLYVGESVAPYAADATKMFQVRPVDRAEDVHVWYRTRIADDAWDMAEAETTNINMDDELLILGTVYDFMIDDGSNPDAAAKYEQQYGARYQQLVNMSMQHGLSKYNQSNGIPQQWNMQW